MERDGIATPVWPVDMWRSGCACISEPVKYVAHPSRLRHVYTPIVIRARGVDLTRRSAAPQHSPGRFRNLVHDLCRHGFDLCIGEGLALGLQTNRQG